MNCRFGFMTHMNNGGIPNHGYTHWWKMFNPLQLLVQAQLSAKQLSRSSAFEAQLGSTEYVLGAFQQYLERNQSLLAFGTSVCDTALRRICRNNNYHPKSNVVERLCFPEAGTRKLDFMYQRYSLKALAWSKNPWELVSDRLEQPGAAKLTARRVWEKRQRLHAPTRYSTPAVIDCQSATELAEFGDVNY